MEVDIFQLPGILRRRWLYLLATVVLCVAVALAYVLRMTPTYSSSTELLLDPMGLVADSGTAPATGAPNQQDQSSLDSQTYVVQSSTILDTVARDLGLVDDPFFLAPKNRARLSPADALTAAVGALRKHITVERAGQSLVFIIGAEHAVPEKAADIANAIAAVYLRQIDEARADAARRASGAFQAQASELRDKVLKAELAVEKFKAENGLVSTGEGGLVLDQQLAGLNGQLIAARGVEEQQQTIYEQTKKLTMAAVKSGGIPEALASTQIGLLRDRYVQLLDRQAQLETNLGANHPQVKAIRSQVENMENALEQELERVRQSMLSNYQRAVSNTKALSDRLAGLTRSSFSSSKAQIQMRQLESEADAVRALYKSFLSRAEELDQQQTLKTNNSRVITAAIASPKSSILVKLIILAAGGLFGVALGAGLAVLRELAGNMLGAREAPKTDDDDTPPLLARIPYPKPASQPGRLTFLSRWKGAGEPDEDQAMRREHHVLAMARRLQDRFAGALPATILFASPQPLSHGGEIVADIVQALIDLGHDLRYAPGSVAKAGNGERVYARPSLVGALGHAANRSAPVADRLKYQHFSSRIGTRAMAARPTFSRFLNNDAGGAEDFTVINACGTEASQLLPSLMANCDAVVVVDEGGKAGELDALMRELAPWRAAILGRIVITGGD